jgi:hypothetical protein
MISGFDEKQSNAGIAPRSSAPVVNDLADTGTIIDNDGVSISRGATESIGHGARIEDISSTGAVNVGECVERPSAVPRYVAWAKSG